ncbi:MAG: DUF86 domain-containing protein [Sphingobacteriaceae bacterium]|nr:MAG: DUF86 domain-containing protein [Sphingobacteriaceae bacterium]
MLRYTNDFTFEQFMQNELTMDAVVRNYEIIGEAATRLSEQYKALLPNLEWQKLKGFRNRLAHEYFGIDYNLV